MTTNTEQTSEERNDLLKALWEKSWVVDGTPLSGEQVVMGYHFVRGDLARVVGDTGNGRRVRKTLQLLKGAGLLWYDHRTRQWMRSYEESILDADLDF